jgi:multiple sugar transport system permease protein
VVATHTDSTDGPTGSTSRPGRAAPVRRKLRRLTTRDITVLALLVGIPVVLDIALIWGPTVASIGLSFTDYKGIVAPHFIGIQNYTRLFTENPQFWTGVRNNVLWLLFLGLIATPLGLFFAVLLDKQIRFSRFYQSALYMPVVLSFAIIGFIAQLAFSRDYGAVNSVLTSFGVIHQPIDWLGDPSLNIWVMLLMAGWRHCGYVMILYLAGLKSIDPALKEAAAIDGANEGQTFFRVVFPAMRPVNIVVFVITVIEGLRAFDIVYAVNQGTDGLQLLSTLVTAYIVGEASDIGYGSAIAVILLLVSLGFVITYLVNIFREDHS